MSWWTRTRDFARDRVEDAVNPSHLVKHLNDAFHTDPGGPSGVPNDQGKVDIVKFSSTDDGKNWNISTATPEQIPNLTTNQGYGSRSSYAAATNGNAYSRSTAATGGDIKQGGMTKDDLIEFNQKHPNETAKVGG